MNPSPTPQCALMFICAFVHTFQALRFSFSLAAWCSEGCSTAGSQSRAGAGAAGNRTRRDRANSARECVVSNRAQWRFRSLRSPLCWRRYVLPLRWTLERDRWRAYCALAVREREAAWNARQKRVGAMQRELSYLVFYARRRVSPGRSEGFLCPGCGLAVVLERHGDTVDKSGRRGTFELWHEAPQCEGFAVFSYSLTQVSEVEAGGDRTKLVQGGVMRIAKHEGLPS